MNVDDLSPPLLNVHHFISQPVNSLRPQPPQPMIDLPNSGSPPHDALLVLLPLLIVLSTFLFLLLLFLVCVLLIRRRRGIILRDSDGPVDMSREERIDGEGGFEGVETRWLESANEADRRTYLRAKDYQVQYPANSLPTDITLSQFLSIQEKGVSAWSFEPDYETVNSLLVHARTEITFLPDPASSSCVQSNLPLPKLNEVYYWEVKMFDLPEGTTVAVGLATKPYPPFRLPGLNRYSVAYHSNGDKSHNYPFTAQPFGPVLREGDVLGIGYRPRTGTVFYTRNGRKMEDAFIGLTRWNLFPTIGADGPCSVHVNLGQAGFVFIEANVKKWGLAPSVGTLAPPPAYGSERGSILLDVGGTIRPSGERVTPQGIPSASSPTSSRRSHRSRRPKNNASTTPIASSPLRASTVASAAPVTPPPPITPIDEEPEDTDGPGPSNTRRYMSPTDAPFHAPPNINLPLTPPPEETSDPSSSSTSPISSRSPSPLPVHESEPVAGARNTFSTPRRPHPSLTHFAAELSSPPASSSGLRSHSHSRSRSGSHNIAVQVHPPPDSPRTPDPPTPNQRDILLQALNGTSTPDVPVDVLELEPEEVIPTIRDPPAYSPLDAHMYADGVHIDLPAEVIAAALEGGSVPESAIGQANTLRPDRRRGRREGGSRH